MASQQYCLKWKYHHSNVQSMFAQLLEKERFCDVTLYCTTSVFNHDKSLEPCIKGVSLRAHRVVLASCSELLGSLLGTHEAQGEPVVVVDGADPVHVKALLDYMYTGEMNVHRSQLQGLLKTAEDLKIKGLTRINWDNKDEPPDCDTDAITSTATKSELNTYTKSIDLETLTEKVRHDSETEKFGVNGGPPPLIKLQTKEKIVASCTPKREISDNEEQNSNNKRKRSNSGTDNSEDEDPDAEWKHGNMDISASCVSWPQGKSEEWSQNEEEWDATDIGSFLHTRLQVDGDASSEDSNDAPPSTSSSIGTTPADPQNFTDPKQTKSLLKPPIGPKSGPTDPRFTDVIKLNDYLRHGRRPQFWEEDYVKRVMEAIRLKQLEMKQAAEILGVSYGTLYGRYRDAYGCINRPFRPSRDMYVSKSAGEILDKFKKGEIPVEIAAQALGVGVRDLYVHFHESQNNEKEFEPIPIEIDPSLRLKNLPSAKWSSTPTKRPAGLPEEFGPTSVSQEKRKPQQSMKWKPTIESIASSASTSPAPNEPGSSTSPSLLMKSRPDLTIVAAKKPDMIKEEEVGT